MMLTRLLPRLYAALNAGRWLRYPPLERAYLSAFFLYKRYAEDPFAGLAARNAQLFRGGHILDVGANVGYTASVFAQTLDPSFCVYAFEPESVNAGRLRVVAARAANRGRIVPVEVAVGESSGSTGLVINRTHPGDHFVDNRETAGSLRVPLISLDDYTEQHQLRDVAFVKIDVQGFELAVSRGMERLIGRSPQLSVAFEYSDETAARFQYGVAELLDFYRERGFILHLLARSPCIQPLTAGSLTEWKARHGYVDILATRQAIA